MSKETLKLAKAFIEDTAKYLPTAYDQAGLSIVKALEEALKQEQGEPCPDKERIEYACKDRHQCWEPCGKLGNSEEHARIYQQEKGEPEEFLLRGILASELKCWHRLSAEELQNLIDFVKNIGAKQWQGEPMAWMLEQGPHVEFERMDYHDGSEWTPLYTTPQPKQEQGEPVATVADLYPFRKRSLGLPKDTPLYTTPQQRNKD